MRAHVVYESMFGNSHAVADAVAAGIRAAVPGSDVTVVNVLAAPDDLRPDLLVVGGPTHAFSLSRPETRASRGQHLTTDEARDAAAREPGADAGRGVREWLEQLGGLEDVPAAAFDTRVSRPVPKRAAVGISKRLRAAGCALVVAPQGFHVRGMHGPLVDGELDRATAWGRQVALEALRTRDTRAPETGA